MSDRTLQDLIDQGVAAHRAGRLDEALACYRAACAQAPSDAEALSLLGLALTHSGEREAALDHLTRAVQLEPRQIGFRVNLAEGLLNAGRTSDGLHELEQVLSAAPGALRAWSMARDAYIVARDWAGLRSVATAWIRAQPGNADAWRAFAHAAFEQGRHVEAMQAFERVLHDASSADDLTTYARIALHALRMDAAAAALDRAEARNRDDPEMLSARSLLAMYFGRFEEAASYARRCLARNPEHAPTYAILSRLARGSLEESDAAAVIRIAQRADAPLDHRVPAAFAAAHAHDARGDVDAAFAAYAYAHSLAIERDRMEGRAYDAAEVERRSERIMALSSSIQSSAARRAGAPRTLFIVGMPRSGTTLIEGVLGAHSRVFACGERPKMREILQAALHMQESGRRPDLAMLDAWSRAYLDDLPPLRGADHVTDKHPLNFEAAGLIPRLFEDAVVLHVRRNPLETCLSIYRQEFSKHWTFAHRLEDIAHYYGCYARLVAHWERTLGASFVTIQYEQFVERFATAARELIATCGLDWEPGCLSFQNAPRAIATFSTVQARGPVRLGEPRAERYRGRLEPLVKALEAAGVDLATGALRA